MRLDPAAAASGVRLLSFDNVGSTNSEALMRGRAGDAGPLWVTAQTQDAGRGRRGREWVSQAGNLFASLLLTEIPEPARAAELSFVAALAVRDAVTALAPSLAPRLKWPNDVLLDGAKFCGILVEGEGGSNARFGVAIGIGVNCRSHPRETSHPATDLAAAGADLTVQDVFARLSITMLSRLKQWDRGAGFAAIRADWLAHATGLGGDIRIRLPDRELAGRFTGIDVRGHLVLALPDGTTRPFCIRI